MVRARKCKECGYEMKTIEVPNDLFYKNNELAKGLRELVVKYKSRS